MKTYNLIYESYEKETDDANKDALNYARCTVFTEYELNEENPIDYRFIDTVNGINVYYQYGADYYFFEEA